MVERGGRVIKTVEMGCPNFEAGNNFMMMLPGADVKVLARCIHFQGQIQNQKRATVMVSDQSDIVWAVPPQIDYPWRLPPIRNRPCLIPVALYLWEGAGVVDASF